MKLCSKMNLHPSAASSDVAAKMSSFGLTVSSKLIELSSLCGSLFSLPLYVSCNLAFSCFGLAVLPLFCLLVVVSVRFSL